MSIADLVLVLKDLEEENNYDNTLLTMLIIGGTALMLGSIGFFVAAQVNNWKALSVSFKNKPALQLQARLIFYRFVPSVTLKISL